MANAVYMTKERAKEIEEELFILKTRGRKDIAQKIADARSHGDLSENADYDAAKHAQELHELKIAKMEEMLINAQIIDPNDLPDGKVFILSKVQLLNMDNDMEINYQLVGPEEADFEAGKISVTSLVGKALLGKEVDDIVEIDVPAGTIIYKILDISK